MILDFSNSILQLVDKKMNYLKKVDHLPSQKVLKDNLSNLAMNSPAVYGIYEGGSFAKPKFSNGTQPGHPAMVLAVIAKNLRDPYGKTASRGVADHKGAYEILEDLRKVLLNKVPAEGFGALWLANEGLFAMQSNTVVYLATYKASYSILPNQ